MILSLISLAIAITCYACSQLQQHGQLRWGKRYNDFWGDMSYVRKYKNNDIKQGPAFFLSTTSLVFLTDGYHFMQFWFFNFLALSLTFALGWNFKLLISLLFGIRILHWLVRKLLSK